MAAPSLRSELARIGQLQAHLPGAVSMMVGVAAFVAVIFSELWAAAEHVDAIAHEGAHAAVGALAGRRVTRVRLFGNGEGDTSLHPPSGPGYILAGIAGYLGPSGFGLGAAELIRIGHSVAVLWFALVLLVLLLIPLSWCFGVISVTGTGLLLFLVARYASVGAQVATAYALAWLLLLTGVHTVLKHGTGARDAGILRDLTKLPRGFWHNLWLTGSLLALVFGGRLLL
jgi:Peptidase M50B-like